MLNYKILCSSDSIQTQDKKPKIDVKQQIIIK